MEVPHIEHILRASLDHVAVAVHSIDAVLEVYRAIGGKAGTREAVEVQGVVILPVTFGSSRIELLQPIGGDTPVGKFLAKRGEGLHHIALRVDDIAQALEDCVAAGIRVLDREPSLGGEGRLIAFLDPHTTGGVLIELTQYPVTDTGTIELIES